MKKIKLIILLTLTLTSILSCSKKDDDPAPTFEELIVQNSPWKFNGVELLNIINTGDEEFDKELFETKIRNTNENVFYSFNIDGTGKITDNSVPEDFIWNFLDGNKLKIAKNDDSWEVIFENLNVTETQLNFMLLNMNVATDVTADVKYLLSK